MSQKANDVKLGLFVIGAVVLITAAVLFFGASSFLRPTIAVETYMDESVDGLAKGSPVKYRGVQIGEVEDIDMVSNVYGDQMPEGAEFEHGRYVFIQASIRPRSFSQKAGADVEDMINEAIANGLRVRMASTGATGLAMYLEADYMDPRESPPLPIDWKPNHIVVPSATSTATRLTEFVEDLTRQAEKMDLDQVSADARQLLQDADQAVTAADLPAVAADLRGLLAAAREDLARADLGALSGRATAFLEHLDQAVADADVKGLRAEASRVFTDLGQTGAHMAEAMETLVQAATELQTAATRISGTVARVDDFVRAQDGELSAAIQDLRRSVASLATLTSDARRNPAGIFFTQPPPRIDPGDR